MELESEEKIDGLKGNSIGKKEIKNKKRRFSSKDDS
jgi:hypothetical protein